MENLSLDTPRSDAILNTTNARSLELSTSPPDLSCLPTETLLKVLDVKRTLETPLDYKFGSLTSSIWKGKSDLDHTPLPYSPIVPRMMNHIQGDYPKSLPWSADLEAIDWTLKGDLLQLKNSYSATLDYQQQEIETLMSELHLCEYDLKSKSADLDRATQNHSKEVSTIKGEIKSLQKTVGELKSENSGKGLEISSLRQKLNLSETQNATLANQLTVLKAELTDTVQRCSARENALQTRVNDLIASNAEEMEKLKLKHSDTLVTELAEQKNSLKQRHDTEVNSLQNSHEHTRENYEQTIKDLRMKMVKEASENKSLIEKMKFDHERVLDSVISRGNEKAQDDERELQRSLNFKHEQQLDDLRRRITSQQNQFENKKRKSEADEEALRLRIQQLTNEIVDLKKQFQNELESTKTHLKTESSDSLRKLEENLTEKHNKEIIKLIDEKTAVEGNFAQSETKLAEIHAKFEDLEKQLHKLERKVVNNIEKTSGQLIRATGLSPATLHKADNVSAALEQLRWTAKETINAYTSNQALVLDICNKWKTFEKEKNEELKKMKRQFETETEDLLAFSKKEINESYKHNMSQFQS